MLGKSYCEDSISLRWCPTPGCEYCVENPDFDKEITCPNFHSFCFNCLQEIHAPCDCHLVKDWISKNKEESLNVKYIVAHCKQCPKCRKPIEKNQGCNHMTCRSNIGGCGYEFCWICLESWESHKNEKGGYDYKCNKFKESKVCSPLTLSTSVLMLFRHK